MAITSFPIKQDLVMRKGDTFSWSFKIVEGFDLTGCEVKSQMRARPQSEADLLATFDITVDLIQNQVTLRLESETTSELDASQGFWDLQITCGTDVKTWFEGKVTIKNQVTV